MRKRFKSLLERDFAKLLKKQKVQFKYEEDRIPFVRQSSYTPDWKIGEKTYLETKGEFTSSQRSNLLSFLEQHPDIKIIMVFAQAKNKLNKKSKMTYAEWCSRHGIEFIDLDAEYIPQKKEYRFKEGLKISANNKNR